MNRKNVKIKDPLHIEKFQYGEFFILVIRTLLYIMHKL